MFNKSQKKLEKLMNDLIKILQDSNAIDWAYILGNKKEIIKRNLLAGIARGVGVGIGVTIITAIIVIVLQKIVTLNIPVIGEYVVDIIDIVEKNT